VELKDIISIMNGGGNIALVLSTYFIFKAAERLARIEKALQKYMDEFE
jgi:hypothetical protein